MLHPFKVGMRADRVLHLEKRNRLWRTAKTEVVGWDGRLIVLWHFEGATLKIGFDQTSFGGYKVREILPPRETGKRLTTKKAKLTAKEAEKQLAKFKSPAEKTNG